MIGKGTTLLLACLPLCSALASPAERSAAISDKDVASAVRSIMDDQYGPSNYNARYSCWDIELKGDGAGTTQYCMKPGKSHVVNEGGKSTLYFPAYNRTDIMGDADYRYSQSDLGLMGAFKAVRDDKTGKWTITAANKSMDYGAGGACGCEDAEFQTIGTDRHAWIFTSGGDWQGTLVLNYAIVTDFDGKFQDVSAIPRIKEGAQGTKYELLVASSQKPQPMFPLVVTRTSEGKPAKEINVAFDPAKRVYALPDGE